MACFDRFRRFRRQVAIDVGTAFFRVGTETAGMVTIPAAVSPTTLLQGGVVVDPGGLADILRPEVTKIRGLGLLGPAVLAGAPTDAQGAEQDALVKALYRAGAGKVQTVPEPLAAAIGANLDISLPYAQMVVDVGEGVTDCIVLRNGTIFTSSASRVGCSTLRRRLWRGLRSSGERSFSLAVAERMLATTGVGGDVPGRKTVAVSEGGYRLPDEVVNAAHAWVDSAVEEILAVPVALLQKVSADVGSEIIESGILLTGGGALLPGMQERLAAATSIPVTIPDNPLETVVRGLQCLLDR